MKKLLIIAVLLAIAGASHAAQGSATDALKAAAGSLQVDIPAPAPAKARGSQSALKAADELREELLSYGVKAKVSVVSDPKNDYAFAVEFRNWSDYDKVKDLFYQDPGDNPSYMGHKVYPRVPKATAAENKATGATSIPAASAVALEKSQAVLRDIQGATPYEKVANLFNSGLPATKRDLAGWHAGRGFTKHGRILGTLLVGQKVSSDIPAGGPLFNNVEAFRVNLFTNEDPYYYDHLGQNMTVSISEILKDWDYSLPMSFPLATGENGPIIVEERMASGHIVERYSKSGQDAMYSYYFMDVTPESSR